MKEKTLILGLTGGIGTGKSTASEYLISKGFLHIDADGISRQITADGSPVLGTLNQVFGPDGEMGIKGVEILDDSGSLIRQALADIVFVDSHKKDRLNEIMLTQIIAVIDEEVRKYRECEEHLKVLLDAPLLLEAGLESRCDKVLLIVAEKDVRVSRVQKRDGITARQVQDRIDNQMSDEEKISRADYIVDNSKDLVHLYRQLDNVVKEL